MLPKTLQRDPTPKEAQKTMCSPKLVLEHFGGLTPRESRHDLDTCQTMKKETNQPRAGGYQETPRSKPKRRQGRQNEFWNTLEYKLLENISIISTPPKT